MSILPHGLCSAWTCQYNVQWWTGGRCQRALLGPSTLHQRQLLDWCRGSYHPRCGRAALETAHRKTEERRQWEKRQKSKLPRLYYRREEQIKQRIAEDHWHLLCDYAHSSAWCVKTLTLRWSEGEGLGDKNIRSMVTERGKNCELWVLKKFKDV